MAQFKLAYKINIELEFSSNPKKFLHKNKTESTITLGGVYRKANPKAINWKFVDDIIKACETKIIDIDETNKKQQEKEDMERASILLHSDNETMLEVFSFFKANYWDNSRLSELFYQTTANRIFLMSVNAGNKTAVKIAQRVSGAMVDGIIGKYSIKAINNMGEKNFRIHYDEACRDYYINLAETKPHLAIYLDGWINRFDRIALIESEDLLFA